MPTNRRKRRKNQHLTKTEFEVGQHVCLSKQPKRVGIIKKKEKNAYLIAFKNGSYGWFKSSKINTITAEEYSVAPITKQTTKNKQPKNKQTPKTTKNKQTPKTTKNKQTPKTIATKTLKHESTSTPTNTVNRNTPITSTPTSTNGPAAPSNYKCVICNEYGGHWAMYCPHYKEYVPVRDFAKQILHDAKTGVNDDTNKLVTKVFECINTITIYNSALMRLIYTTLMTAAKFVINNRLLTNRMKCIKIRMETLVPGLLI